MNEPLLAKFYLQYNKTPKEFVQDKFIDTNLFPDIIESKYEQMRDDYADQVAEELMEIFITVEYDENENCYIHPETEEPIEYDNWDDLWYEIREEMRGELEESFVEMVFSEVEKEYSELEELRLIVSNYLEEIVEYDWPR